jgi:PEGA domain
MRRLVGVAMAVAIAGGLVEGVARATDEEDALIRRAIELRKHGNDRDALADVQRAYEIAHSPRAAAQLGFAEQALGLWPQAEEHVDEALRASNDPWIRKNRAVVEQARETIRAHVGRLQIVGGQPGAQVTVNDRSVGSMPLADAVAVSAGPVDVEVRAAGYARAVKTINVAPGEYARVSFALQPAPARVPAPPALSQQPRTAAAGAPPGYAPATATEPPLPLLTETPHDPGRGRRIAGISLVAGGVAVIGGGIAASVIGKNKFDAIGADAAADRPYNDANGNWKGYETAAAVAYVLGGSALVGGVVLYVTGRAHAAEGQAPTVRSIALSPALTAGRAGASLSVRF